MIFNSFQFALFLPLVFAAYWLLRNHIRWQNLLIVAASYVFYGWWDWRFLILIAFTSGCSYIVGLLELRHWDAKPSKVLLTISLVVNLGILGYFKYYNFFLGQAVAVLNAIGFEPNISSLKIILPVGISFYTFQALSYTIDVYRRQIRPTRDPFAFFAFISFFPQLVAGPIERATNLLPQFLVKREFDYPQAVIGCRQMLWGFFKKMVIADNCAVVANTCLNNPQLDNGFAVVCGVFFFTFQIYGDFSGYSDIAIGCSRLFGIKLMRNFAFPYFARDIAEFWRRWHISLTTWFRDYLYIPLGGSKCSKWKQIRNTFVIFLVSGFWHGANWTFIFWGAFHAVLFLPLLLAGKNRKYLDGVAANRPYPSFGEFGTMLATFGMVMMGWSLFRAQTIFEWWRWIRSIASLHSWHFFADVHGMLETPLYMIIVMIIFEWISRNDQFGLSRLPRCKVLRWSVYAFLVFTVFIGSASSSPFIYFQF